MFKTRITDLFGIRYPVIQSGMRYVSQAQLVAAVANAGGLGFLSAHSFSSPQTLHEEIEKIRSLTDKPFGVNLTLLPNLSMRPEEMAQVILDAGVTCVETAGGNPTPFIPLFKSTGIKVLHKCTAVRFALKAERLGADAVSLTGFEAAGHLGEDNVPNSVLIPLAVDTLTIPVVANGGFTDGRGLVSALALGAEGIGMGTRFLMTKESPMPDAVKARYLSASECDTTLICRSIGDSTRVLSNDLTGRILTLEQTGDTSHAEVMALASSLRWVQAAEKGDPDDGAYAAGMGTGLIHDVPSCDELIRMVIDDARTIIDERLRRLAG